uniref:E5 n=1 Tax=Macrostomum lignano TaxID=282301 RepID=A0A1I8GZV7_9PLAT
MTTLAGRAALCDLLTYLFVFCFFLVFN